MSCHIQSTLLPLSEKIPFISPPFTLTLQEGRQLLQQLIPGSAEYLQLQDLLLKTTGIFEINVKGAFYKIDTVSDHCKLLGGFGGSEHAAIGKAVQLQGLDEDRIILTVGPHQLQFSHIVALAGDFYGVPGQAISLPDDGDSAKTMRFHKAFKSLLKTDDKALKELKAILAEINKESRDVTQSGTPHQCYSHCTAKGMNALKKIKHDYQDLLIDNSDHFEKNAEDAYRIGHTLALQVAKEAGKTQNKEKLKEAYALDAFACHFLTDLFAAGHIRNQRGKLEIFIIQQLKASLGVAFLLNQKFFLGMSKKIAGVLTAAQHEEDGKNGLEVQNQDQEKKIWQSYGDGFYFSPQSQDNQKRVIEATQQSANEIYSAYRELNQELESRVTYLIPRPTKNNLPPLYVIRGDSLIFYENNEEIFARKGVFAIKDILSHALKYLPQSYINGFIFPDKESSPWRSKLAVPLLRQFMGSVVSVAGIATYHQVETESRQLNDKIDESAVTIKKGHENTTLILEELIKIKAAFNSFEDADWIEFRAAKSKVKNILHGSKYLSNLWVNYKERSLEDLFQALVTLSRLGMKQNKMGEAVLLINYKEKIRSHMPTASDHKITLLVALWFRKTLELQGDAFTLYHCSDDSGGDIKDYLQPQLEIGRKFFKNFDQTKEIVMCSSSYIRLQLEKIGTLEQNSFTSKEKNEALTV